MYEGRVEKGLQYKTGKKPIKWEEHREVNCVPCDLYAVVKRGGRKRKIARKGKEKTIGTGHPPCLSEQHISKPQIKRSV